MATYLAIKDVAAELRVSRRTIQRYIKNGWLRPTRITPRNIRVSRQALEEFISNAERGKLSEKPTPVPNYQPLLPFSHD